MIASLPILITLVLWWRYSKKDPAKYKNFSYLLAVFQDKVIENIEFETISENEPSVSEFKEWMKDLSDSLEKELIIVYDNMDRLPAEKVKELWSSIHTFFSDNYYNNIWVIIPFDRPHLANAFGENNNPKPTSKAKELTCHFINKTFPVIYRVTPPVMTDWKKIFNDYFKEAFGDIEDCTTIQRIFGILKKDFTPRDIISFINELVSIKRNR